MNQGHETPGELVLAARKKRRLSQAALAKLVGSDQQTIGKIEKGITKHSRLFPKLALELALPLETLMPDAGLAETQGAAPRNAEIAGPVLLTGKIPVYGHAVGGKDGAFPLNGNKSAEIAAPPAIAGVVDAYAVYVVGNSMEPRYYSGEAVFVNPHLPVRKGDYVVAQIADAEGEPPLAFIKKFVSRDDRRLRLEQYNPKKQIEFPASAVASIHRIVMSGWLF